MLTLSNAIEQTKCRKGKSDGTTKDGAYWLATKPIVIRSWGSDGIGSNPPDRTNYLELRHYRDGQVRARVNLHSWHQNGAYSGAGDWYANADAILPCESVEAVIVALKGMRYNEWAVYSDHFEDTLTKALVDLGIAEATPAPDEATA